MKNKHLSGNIFNGQPLTMRETSLSARIAGYLSKNNIYNDRLNCGKIETRSGNSVTLCKTGTPDIFAIVRGYIVFIEVKKLGEKPSPEQLSRHEELRRSGAIVLVVDSYEKFLQEFSAINGNLDIFKINSQG